jgi:AraC-like DNA-binding protein
VILRHESELGWWEMISALPHPALRPHVLGYTGYTERTSAPLRRREVPTGRAGLIISFGPSIDVVGVGRLRSFAIGVDDAFAITEHAGDQHGVQVDLSPLGARMILGMPMREVTRQVVALEDVLGPAADRLTERLALAPNWTARFAILDTMLAGRLGKALPPPPHIVHAFSRLEETHGAVPVSELAAELGCSRRHLSATFASEVGLPPKAMARVLRFRHVISLLREDGGARWAEIAYASGYADQPHLNRDFRDLAGVTPSEFVASLLPDGGGVGAAA